jgi:putative ABC transport system permease protein
MNLRYAFRNLWRSRVRSFVTLVGVASLLFLVCLLCSVLNGIYNQPEQENAKVRLVTRHEISLTFPLPESYWEEIRVMPHVVEACPMSWFGGRYGEKDTFFARFFVDPDSLLEVLTEARTDEAEIAAWKEDRAGALASRKLATRLGWKIGDRIPLVGDIYPMTAELTLRALYDGGDEALYFHREYVAQALEDEGGRQVGTYSILVESPEVRAQVAEAVDARYADSGAPTKTETENEFQAGFVEMMGNVKGLMTRIMLAIAVTIVITAGNTMAMAVRERTREIAVLKAVGFTPGRILGLVLGEAMALALLAALLGIGGFAAITTLVFDVLKLQPSFLWFPLTLPLPVLASLLAGAVLLGLLAGLAPAVLATRLPVIDGLRRNG